MKYSILINQVGIVEHNLHQSTDLIDWAIIEYIKSAQLSSGMKKITRHNQELVWVNYKHLLLSMPLLKLNNTASISTRLNKLYELELIHKYKTSPKNKEECNRVYCCITDKTSSIIEFKKTNTTLNLGKDPISLDKEDNSINISNNKYKDISKDIYNPNGFNSIVFKSKFIKKVIYHWNGIEYTSNIKTEKASKTIDKIDEYLKQLRKGTFLQKNTLSPFCRRKNNIPDNLYKKYSRQEILKGIDNLALFFKGEYEPTDKTCLPKSLLSLIYNPIGKTSWLMQAMYNPPKLVANTIKVKDQYPEITKFFVDKLNGNVENIELRTKLVYGIKSIMEFQGKIPVKTLDVPKLNREFGDRLNLCKNYWEWLEQQDWIEEITPVCIRTKGKLWPMFVKEMEEDCDGYRLQ